MDEACGACRRVGELLCCEGCPAVFHLRCAGYSEPSEVPEGDWFCWFCAKERKIPYQYPNGLFKPPRASNCAVLLASDDTAERFYRCRPLAMSDKFIELQYMDIEHDDEVVERSSIRLWHGTTDKNSWTVTEGVLWRPNCRLLQVDRDAPAGDQEGAGRQHGSAAAAPAGLKCVPAGEIGAGLPVVVGGAGKDEFDAALASLWRSLLGPAYPERMPACLLTNGHPVEAWHLWREVWSWGGPDAVSRNKLWATIGFSFNTPLTCTAVSSRIRKSYDTVIEPLDQAIDEGTVQLQRPACTRQPKHRALQLRPSFAAVTGRARPSARPRPTGGSSASRRRQRPSKRRRAGWSSEDEPAPDMGSDLESGEEGEEDRSDEYSDDEGSEEQEESEQQDASPPHKLARTVASSRAARAAAAAAAAGAGAAGDVREGKEVCIKDAVGKPIITTAALQTRVGQVVDFRTWQHGLRCATGWRSGVVLAMDAGSVWEGGSRFLVQPRHAHHSGSQPNLRSQASMPQPGSPAAAALAAMTAAGVPAAGEVATQAASKLLTPSGHLRHEVAGLIGTAYRPLSPGLSKLSLDPAGSLGSHSSLQGQRQQLAAAAGGGAAGAGAEADGQADASRPAWVPLLWRGTAQQPLPKPLVMVRPHSAAAAAQQQHAAGAPSQLGPAAAAATMNSTGASPFSRQQVQQQGQQQVSLGVQQLKPRMIIEALHQGCWWPAEVQAVKTVDAQEQQQQHLGAAGGGTPSSSVSGMAGAACCVVLKNLDPPEADGTVWRFSAGHTMRPAHPQHASGYGVLAAVQDDILPLSQLRKQIAPYTYAGGIQAYACLSHLADSRRVRSHLAV